MKHTSIGRSREAIEGLPLTMIVTMVILAITIPMIIGSLRAYDRGRVEQELSSEINDFITMTQLVYTSGPGNSAEIEFNVPNGGMIHIDSVIFGDCPGSAMASVIRYVIHGRAEVLVVLESPNVPMMSQNNTAFQISPGAHTILAECVSGNFNPGVNNVSTAVLLSLVQ